MSHPQKGIRSLTIIKLKFNIMKSNSHRRTFPFFKKRTISVYIDRQLFSSNCANSSSWSACTESLTGGGGQVEGAGRGREAGRGKSQEE